MKTKIQTGLSLSVRYEGKSRCSFAVAACSLLWLASVGMAAGQTPPPHSHLDRGSALAEKGDLDGAIAEFRQAVQQNPNDVDAHYNLGIALHSKGDLEGAIAEFREAIRLKPDFTRAHINLGNTLDDKGDRDGAIAEYRKALILKPDDADAHFNLAVTLHRGETGTAPSRNFRKCCAWIRIMPMLISDSA